MAQRLAEMLREHGVPVWYSQTNLIGAQQWHDEIGQALGRCDWFLVLLSPGATRPKWVKRELLYALRSVRYENRIIPLRSRRCDVDKLSWGARRFSGRGFHPKIQHRLPIFASDMGIGYSPKA